MRSATSRWSISVASLTRTLRLEIEQAEQNRRRDVVGKVACDANRTGESPAASRPRRCRSRARRRPRSTRSPAISARGPATRSRSISMATSRETFGASLSVRMPAPGPISRKTSSGEGAIASMTLSAQTGSRKCCPKRFRVRMLIAGASVASPLVAFAFGHDLRDSNRTRPARRTGRRAASACRCGGRGESACLTLSSTPRAGARRRAAARRQQDLQISRCRSGSSRAARAGRPAGREHRAHARARRWPSFALRRAVRRARPSQPARRRRVRSTSARAMPTSDLAFDRKKPVE